MEVVKVVEAVVFVYFSGVRVITMCWTFGIRPLGLAPVPALFAALYVFEPRIDTPAFWTSLRKKALSFFEEKLAFLFGFVEILPSREIAAIRIVLIVLIVLIGFGVGLGGFGELIVFAELLFLLSQLYLNSLVQIFQVILLVCLILRRCPGLRLALLELGFLRRLPRELLIPFLLKFGVLRLLLEP